jgi:hypothetical protein
LEPWEVLGSQLLLFRPIGQLFGIAYFSSAKQMQEGFAESLSFPYLKSSSLQLF